VEFLKPSGLPSRAEAQWLVVIRLHHHLHVGPQRLGLLPCGLQLKDVVAKLFSRISVE
jgi:hypothetical protein